MADDRYSFHVGLNVFVVRGGALLLGRRKGFGEGTWGLPGGHMEVGEKMEDGARRELREETGLEATSLRFVNLTNDREHIQPHHYLDVGFLAEDPLGEPQVREPDRFYEWRWFGKGELPKEIFFANRKQIDAFFVGEIVSD
ncbi:MAG TPA: NUDIX domain-containing protein [Candidatus Paceibacterota bacterium]|nr:NUDIX domain-containing protein [Candidatus Paceibacterota bacterium]